MGVPPVSNVLKVIDCPVTMLATLSEGGVGSASAELTVIVFDAELNVNGDVVPLSVAITL